MALAIIEYFFLRSECLEPNIKYYIINCLWILLGHRHFVWTGDAAERHPCKTMSIG